MTIDEAITLVKIERECVIRADVCDRKCKKCDLLQDSTELADMYEHLAEWLELLKWYEQGMEDIPSESGVFPKDVYHAGYNKALNDFVNVCKKQFTTMYGQKYVDMRDIKEIAEQLKAGITND